LNCPGLSSGKINLDEDSKLLVELVVTTWMAWEKKIYKHLSRLKNESNLHQILTSINSLTLPEYINRHKWPQFPLNSVTVY